VNEVALPVSRVIVVGAGIAGLAAASRLRRASIPYVVLEARDRIGGRLHTVDLAGVPVDLGGSWIHHPIGNPLSSLCVEYGLACEPGDPIPTLTGYDRREHRHLDRSQIGEFIGLVMDGFEEAGESLGDRLAPEATAHDAIEAFIVERGFVGAAARRARQGLLAAIEADAGDLAVNQSIRWLGDEEEYGGDLFGDLPRDGYRSVVEALAAPLDVKINTEVVSVRIASDGVVVTCADGTVETGSHAIVSVPLGVLKGGRPRFDPALPPPVQAAVESLGFGRYEKIALRFDAPFWRREGISHLMVFPSDDNEPAMWVFDLDAFGAGPVLCAHLFHSLTPYALDRSPTEAATWLRDVLSEVVGHAVPEPVATVVTSWSHDPFTGGAYTHCPPGVDPSMFDLLAQPVEGRLLLAGEHTDGERTGYADGAYASGLRAASMLAGDWTSKAGAAQGL
jgi:polyamine oxidase